MEHISEIIPQIKLKAQENICVVGNRQLRTGFLPNGEFYISKYQDQTATPEQIKEILSFLFAVWNYDNDAKIAMTSAVIRAEMTLMQLKDAVNNVISTSKFRPTPAEIVNYDKVKTEIEIYSVTEVYKMAKGAARYFYDHNLVEVVKQSTQIFERAKNTYFQKLTDTNGTPKRDKNGFAMFVFTEKGEQKKDFLLQFLRITDVMTVKYHDERIKK